MKAYRVAALRPIIERLAGHKLMKSFGGRIRFFGIGGAPLDPETESFLRHARFPYAIGYGLTETAPIIAASAVGRTRQQAAGPRPAGRRDPSRAGTGRRRRPGAPRRRARGPRPNGRTRIFPRSARTAEAFTRMAFSRRATWATSTGKKRFYVRGRSKTMILGPAGENIYPEEVEAVLNSSPYVLESLVYGDASGLTALVQLKPRSSPRVRGDPRRGIRRRVGRSSEGRHRGDGLGHRPTRARMWSARRSSSSRTSSAKRTAASPHSRGSRP